MIVPDHLLIAIDHVGIAVPDLDAAIEFYEATFGLRVVHQEVNEEQGVHEAMLAVGDSGSWIQLLAPLSEDSTIGRFLSRRGQGIQQLAYRVRDVEAGVEWLPIPAFELTAMYHVADRRYEDVATPRNHQRGRMLRVQVQFNY